MRYTGTVDCFAQNRWIALKLCPPQVVHQHHNAVAARLGFLLGKRAAYLRRSAQHRENAGSRADDFYLDRMFIRPQRDGLLFHGCHGLEAVAVPLPVDEVVGGHRQLRIDVAELGNLLFEHY